MTHIVSTIIVGGGQAGLALGYYLKQQGRDFLILDASTRVGDAWRNRWDSLKLFTPAAFSSLPGLPFPASGPSYPSKDAMADYLEHYAARFTLPIRLKQRVDSLEAVADGFLLQVGDACYRAKQVVVASGAYHTPFIPSFASQLRPEIKQLHSRAYRHPGQLPEGAVLLVGAGNSGAEIAMDVAATHRVYLSGRDTGSIPGLPAGPLGLAVARPFWALLSRVDANADTAIGRRLQAAGRHQGTPLIRLNPSDLVRAGVVRVPRTESVCQGKPKLADGWVLEVSSVIWATGFKPDLSWIKLPILGSDGYPVHQRGVVGAAPGLYFLGLPFQHSVLSAVVGGVGYDARYLGKQLT